MSDPILNEVSYAKSMDEVRDIVVHRAEDLVRMLKEGEMTLFMGVAVGEKGFFVMGCQVNDPVWQEKMKYALAKLVLQFAESCERLGVAGKPEQVTLQ